VLSKCGWSPFEGETFRSTIVSTLVNGESVWHEGQIVESGTAARLQFKPQL
jgi:dihydroorotase